MDGPTIYTFEASSPPELLLHPCSFVLSNPFSHQFQNQQYLCKQELFYPQMEPFHMNNNCIVKSEFSFKFPYANYNCPIKPCPKYNFDNGVSLFYSPKNIKHMKPSFTRKFSTATVIPKKEKAKKTSITETLNMKDAVQEMEERIGQKLALNYFCEKYNIKRRVLYDFLSIMNGLHICTRYSNEEFQWNGAKLDITILSKIKKNAKQDNRPIHQIFNCNDKIGLNFVCYNLISLFIYLNSEVLDLKKVAKLFASSGPALRTMLRKMYTISSSLETIGFISRTGRPAEIKLSPIFFSSTPSDVSISSLLNSYNEDEIIYAKRREEFDSL